MSMDNVFEKTRELAQALIESEAYQNMKDAEDRAMKNQRQLRPWRSSWRSVPSWRT